MIKYRRRLPRRRKGPLPFRYVLFLTFVFFIFSTTAGLWIIEKAIEPALLEYAENETEKIAAMIIKNAIDEQISKNAIPQDEMSFVNTDEYGRITNFNTQIINKMSTETLSNIEKYLKYVNEGQVEKLNFSDIEFEKDEMADTAGFVFRVPLGEVTNNSLLGNLGPEIPIKFHMISFATTEPVETIEEWGINNAWLRVNVVATVKMQVILPFSTGEVVIETPIPVISQVLEGEVPEFYNNGNDSSPSIEIPTN